MTTTPNDRIPALEAELDDLDVPVLPITDVLRVIADWAGITDVQALLTTIVGDARAQLSPDEVLASDLLDLALESTTQIPHIRRAMQIEDELDELDQNR